MPQALVLVVSEDLKQALLSRDTFRRDALRFLSSALKNEAIDLRKPFLSLTDEEAQAVIRRSAKQRRDSIQSFRDGGREDLATKEEAELHLLEKYLPAELSPEVLEGIVHEAVAEMGARTRGDLGKVMGAAMKKVAGRASGDVVRAAVARALPE